MNKTTILNLLTGIIDEHDNRKMHQSLKPGQVQAIHDAITIIEHTPFHRCAAMPLRLGESAWPENLYQAVGSELIPPYNKAQLAGIDYLMTETLNRTERIVLLGRFQHASTFKDLAKELGITPTRAEQAEKGAIRKLARPNRKRIMEVGVTKADKIRRNIIATNADNPNSDPQTLNELEFSTRTANALRRANIKTIKDLTCMSEEQLMKVHNLGTVSVQEIKDTLADHGLSVRK